MSPPLSATGFSTAQPPRWGGILLLLAGLGSGLGWEALNLATQTGSGVTLTQMALFLHLLAALGLVGAVLMLQTQRRTCLSKTLRVGAAGLLLAALGLCLLTGMQAHALLCGARGAAVTALYLPVQGMLLLGGGVYSAGCYHVDATRPWAKRLFLVALAWGLLGSLWAWLTAAEGLWVQQGIWRGTTLGYLWLGSEIVWAWRPDVDRYRPGQGWRQA